MDIIIDQLRKISTFFYILILLFVAAIFFNLNFQWEGITIILRVYLFIISFYIVYNFSILDISELKEEYKSWYKDRGDLYLFFAVRVAPICIIYFIIIIFTFISYIGSDNWVMESVLNILNGRYSNTLIYSLILLIILRVKKSPTITIPLFLILSVVYFLVFKAVYAYSPIGIPTSILKIFNFIIVIFLMLFEFFYNKKNLLKLVFLTLILANIFHFLVTGLFWVINMNSSLTSYGKIRSTYILLKMGYSSPLDQLESIVKKSSRKDMVKYLIYYSDKYEKKIDFTIDDWEKLMFSNTIKRANLISRYLLKREKKVSYESLITFAEMKSVDSGEQLLNSHYFTKYSAWYCEKHFNDLTERFKNQNIYFRLWVIRLFSYARLNPSIPFLIDKLTHVNERISEAAYSALTNITRLDPANEQNIKINSADAIKSFRDYFYRISREN